MNVILINGSPRKGGNTQLALNDIAAELEAAGIKTQHVQIGNMRLWGCQACMACSKSKDARCIYGDEDGLNPIIQQVLNADGVVIGSPTYFGSLTTATKAFIDRCGYTCRAMDRESLAGKVGATVAVHRRAGALGVYHQINQFFGINQMPIATSSYWAMVDALKPGDYKNDTEGIETMKQLGQNMANMILKLRGK